ncbi:unnamed protein product [Effrenium voratum]|nr:unnamed protein product [Effrenium voratum]
MAKRLPRHRQLRSESSEQKVETKEMEDDQKRQGKERHAQPVHKGSARRAPEAAKPAGEISEAGRLPEWLFEDRPVWLEALVRFLHEPDLLLVRLERGSSQRVARRPAAGVLPEMQELSLPFEKLRSWATGELQQAADEGRKVRSVAVCGTDKSHAADAVEVLRSMGFQRVANVHTQALTGDHVSTCNEECQVRAEEYIRHGQLHMEKVMNDDRRRLDKDKDPRERPRSSRPGRERKSEKRPKVSWASDNPMREYRPKEAASERAQGPGVPSQDGASHLRLRRLAPALTPGRLRASTRGAAARRSPSEAERRQPSQRQPKG